MMREQRPLSLKTRLGIATLTLAMLVSAAGGGLVATQSVEGIPIVGALVGRAIVRTISHKAEEKADRKAINQRRDAEKAQEQAESAAAAAAEADVVANTTPAFVTCQITYFPQQL